MFSHALLLPTLLSLFSLASSAQALEPRAFSYTATTTVTVQATITQTIYWDASPTETTLSTALLKSVGATASSSAVSSKVTASSSKAASSTSKAASVSAATATSTSIGTGSSKPIVAAYYPDWVTMTPEEIDWAKVDWIDFAFAVVDSNLDIVFTDDNSGDLLTRAVTAGHKAGKKVKLSIGGWSGSTYFSQSVASASARTALVTKVLAMYTQYNVDGIDIDWEYPATAGNAGNVVSSSDTANFLLFLQQLRKTLPSTAKISAATQVWPFTGPDGNPLTDVSAFAKVLDWISIMVYDVWGSSSTPGPNAPLSDGCNDSLQPLANAYAAVNSWTTAGFPAAQIVLATAAYGYISQSTATTLIEKRAAHRAKGKAWSSKRSTSVTLYNESGGSTDGQIMFSEIIAQGGLVWNATTKKWVGGGGFTRYWDACSSTPFLRSATSGQVITYDDPDSLLLKAEYALQVGLGGVNMWDIHGDDADFDLLASLRSGLGLAAKS